MKYALYTALLYILCGIAVATRYPTYQVPANFVEEYLRYNQTEAEEIAKEMVEVYDVSLNNSDSVSLFDLGGIRRDFTMNRNRYVD